MEEAKESDEELMMMYQAGDAMAFEKLYSRFSPRVYGLVKKYIRNQEVAHDLFQSTFLRIHTKRATFKKGYLVAPWILTVTKNVVLDHLRKEKTRLKGQTHYPLDFSPEIELTKEVDSEINLSSLGENQKRAFELRYRNSFSFSQIAKVMRTSEANVRQLISRGIKKLRGES